MRKYILSLACPVRGKVRGRLLFQTCAWTLMFPHVQITLRSLVIFSLLSLFSSGFWIIRGPSRHDSRHLQLYSLIPRDTRYNSLPTSTPPYEKLQTITMVQNLHLHLTYSILSYIIIHHSSAALPDFGGVGKFFGATSWLRPIPSSSTTFDRRSNNLNGLNYNPNGSAFLWLPDVEYSGKTFFEWVTHIWIRNEHAHDDLCLK